MSFEAHAEACAKLRRHSLHAVAETVTRLREDATSESEALSMLLKELQRGGLHDYWYPSGEEVTEKQSGCVVRFDTPEEPRRTAFANARVISASPDIRWKGVGYFYTSPVKIDVDTHTVAMGDFGCTVYIGTDWTVRKCFREAWLRSEKLIASIATSTKLTTNNVFGIYSALAQECGTTNLGVSLTTARAGGSVFNIGHSFPQLSLKGLTLSLLDDRRRAEIANARKFIDGQNEHSISQELWSIEPREVVPNYPYGTISFHRMFAKTRSGIQLLPDCRDFFLEVGMGWINA